jgi:choloylglycine hydrolase
VKVHDNLFHVLTNAPTYDWHLNNIRNHLSLSTVGVPSREIGSMNVTELGQGGGLIGLPADYTPPSRFVRAAYVNAHYPDKANEEENVSRAFHTLQQVAMVDGSAAMGSGEFEKTIYTGLFSSRTGTYYWNTYEDPAIHSVAMADHETDGTKLVVV